MTVLDQKPAALTDIALTVLKKRYLIKDDHGRVAEAPETMFRRVADTIAEVDRRYGASADEARALRPVLSPHDRGLLRTQAGRPLAQIGGCQDS